MIDADWTSLVDRKVTVTFPGFLEGTTATWFGTLLGVPVTCGWRTPGGGWALHAPSEAAEKGYAPSYRIRVRRRGAKKGGWLRLDEATAVELDW
jgi:hypothetical protein